MTMNQSASVARSSLSTMTTPQIVAIGLVASDLDRTVAFYRALGCDLPDPPGEDGGHLATQLGDFRLMICISSGRIPRRRRQRSATTCARQSSNANAGLARINPALAERRAPRESTAYENWTVTPARRCLPWRGATRHDCPPERSSLTAPTRRRHWRGASGTTSARRGIVRLTRSRRAADAGHHKEHAHENDVYRLFPARHVSVTPAHGRANVVGGPRTATRSGAAAALHALHVSLRLRPMGDGLTTGDGPRECRSESD